MTLKRAILLPHGEPNVLLRHLWLDVFCSKKKLVFEIANKSPSAKGSTQDFVFIIKQSSIMCMVILILMHLCSKFQSYLWSVTLIWRGLSFDVQEQKGVFQLPNWKFVNKCQKIDLHMGFIDFIKQNYQLLQILFFFCKKSIVLNIYIYLYH